MHDGFINVPGGKIYYRQYGVLDNNIPLILIHGGPGFSHDTLRVLTPMAEKRAIIFYDQLGCGASDRPQDKSLWQIPRSIEELECIIDYFNLDNYHLLGHSFGACIALDYALKKPAQLRSITLSSPLISVTDWIKDTRIRKNEMPRKIQENIDKHEAAGTTDSQEYKDATKIFNENFLCRLNPLPDLYLEACNKFNTEIYNFMWGPSEFNCTGNLLDYERAEKLNEIYYPVLLLCGAYDEVRVETLISYQAKLPKSLLHIFMNSSHNTYLEETQEYINVVNNFCSSIEKKDNIFMDTQI